MKLFDRTLGTLERALDARLLRHNVLAGNLANSDTPGFVPRDVSFDAAMAQARQEGAGGPRAVADGGLTPGDIPLGAAGGGGAAGAGPALTAAAGAGPGIDGNAVDADRALAALAENAVQYGAAARAAGKKLAILRYAASDGVG
jgi:flagellar basal-body rod protein FlgB